MPTPTVPFHWQQRFCPILTAANMGKATPSSVIARVGAEPADSSLGTAAACQGARCMFFVPMAGKDGIPRGDGGCAMTVGAMSLAAQTESTESDESEPSPPAAEHREH
jgi:hypothetical protein